ncbi:YusW family protein [Anaerobacillus isosaccharinicus]|uniref:YusW-like protein n=1 Tax=Anaerobacillus isosaccharinicus TaxID=1532552 RepID=A0A1S2LHP5_9BACI|nr:YusW family protein [Anaerobacillus isosaccharinicus]MBA5584730.1 hypothetical protein [Anaerobacillus isosaccharinicus]QOY36901.1 hypothetical protein AWH56_004425 [Anaerobacillus isosaccharinicus]
MKKTALVIFTLFVLSFMTAQSVYATTIPTIIDFEIEIELKDNTKYDIEYEVKAVDKIEAKYSVPGSVTAHGKNAVAIIEPLMKELELKPKMDQENLKQKILEILSINKTDVEDFELEVKFDNGEKIKIDN